MATKEFIYKKTGLLKAMERILKEYKKNDHIANVADCSLCMLYNRDNEDSISNSLKGHECRLCPMYIFYRGNDNWYPCMKRRCTPIDCDGSMTEDLNELKAVIRFYEEAIEIVKGMTVEQLNEPQAFVFLIKIDKLCAKEFCLV